LCSASKDAHNPFICSKSSFDVAILIYLFIFLKPSQFGLGEYNYCIYQ
jgi:hypothetical protein